jgi:NAD(P)-dependent dehydrogenase (short-subunit alcohol dehydrogenase family)
MLAINGRGVFLCYKYAAKQMIKQGRGGRIIGAASTGAKQGKKDERGGVGMFSPMMLEHSRATFRSLQCE